MPLWGTTDGTKPKWLTDAEKQEVFATSSGYVVEPGSKMTGNGNVNAQPEILVAIRNLATRIGAATITEIEFMTTAFSKGAGGTLSMRVRYNEEVTVTGVPRFVINNTTNAARHQTCTYVSGSGTNELIFGKTLSAGSGDINASDVLNVIANPLAQHGGSTIKDKGTTTDSEITSSTAIGTAAGTLTIAA